MNSRTIACAVVLTCPLFALGSAQATTLTAIPSGLSANAITEGPTTAVATADGVDANLVEDLRDLTTSAQGLASSLPDTGIGNGLTAELPTRKTTGTLADLYDANPSGISAGLDTAIFENGTLVTYTKTPLWIKRFWGRISDSPFAKAALAEWREQGRPPLGGWNKIIRKKPPTPPAVPLPASVWLFVSGLLGLIAITRSRAGTLAQNADLATPGRDGATLSTGRARSRLVA